ncbi:MAG: sulfate adenylyltransferase subunit CysN [Deltaproteobacteria bacterium]|nr:sulfate adenylyltransferase subunit CysN [Deltaproteobacteria bacterium]
MDIKQFLDRDEQKDLLRFLTAGSVDDGKSTLIGRLLYDSKLLYDDQLATLERDSKRVGSVGGEIDYALLLDGLKAEREQGITIDVAYRYFATAKRKFIIADTPGHEQYTRNMVTGTSTANLAIILVDARTGVITQTRRHTFIVSLLGIKHVILAVNKMDLVDYDQEVFERICQDYRDFVARLKIPDLHFIPLSALKGDNVVKKSVNTPWYSGAPLLKMLESIYISSDRNIIDFRFPVQYVLRPDAAFRGFAGKVASGVVRPGEEIMVLPSGKRSKVKTISIFDGDLEYAFPPESITLTLEDEIDISRGDMLVHPNNIPRTSRSFEAMLVWMDEKNMDLRSSFFIKHTTQTTRARIERLRYRTDVNSLRKSDADHLSLNEIGRVSITTSQPLYFDPYMKNHQTGSFILIDPLTNFTSAVGMIIDRVASENGVGRKAAAEVAGSSQVSRAAWEERLGQQGKIHRIAGATLEEKEIKAHALERRLFEQGKIALVVDEIEVSPDMVDRMEKHGLIVVLMEKE